MEAIEAGQETAAQNGMEAWAYDVNGCPSGFAAGIVPRQDPAFGKRD